MYLIYLDKVQLPITPSKISMKIKNKNVVITLINDGELNLLKAPGLTEISFEISLPQVKYPFASYPNGLKNADYFMEKLEKLKVNKKPFQFICSRKGANGKSLFDTNLKVSLEGYSVEENAKEGLDVLVTVELKQYIDFKAKTLTFVEIGTSEPKVSIENSRSTESAVIPKTYTVQDGDCLWNIAKRYLGDGSRYTEIYELNKDKIINPNLIYTGITLTMPAQ
ncbi:peptidoglycan-binding protein [Clostridia bacterium]|nr:peptidoglycan-binding protein [Clostridia bacterium]